MIRWLLAALLLLTPAVARADWFNSGPYGGSGGPPSGTAGGDLSGTYPNPSIGSVLAPSHGGTGAISITQAPYNASVGAADNATAIQAAINAAVAAGVPLLVPADPNGGCYKYTAPLTISGNLTIQGTYVAGNWPGTGQINVPGGSPPLLGSVLCPTSNGSDGIDISGTALQVNVSNIGMTFQTPFTGTGDGWHYVPSGTNQGLSGGTWWNVPVYGHDGNHYAYNLQNVIYATLVGLSSWGGGGLNFYGTSSTFNYGNTTIMQPVAQVVVGGTAHGFNVAASAGQRNNLILFLRPQAIINNAPGITPVANPPTSAQQPWIQDPNSYNVKVVAGDFEQNVGSPITLGSAAHGNDMDWGSTFTTASAINAPSWGNNGLLYGPQTRTLTDTTSSGTIAFDSPFAFPGITLKASNPTTISNAFIVYVGAPTCSTNVTCTRQGALYANGIIFSTGNMTSSAGLFSTGGTVQLNHNSNFVTQIGDGTTTSTVTIGGNANTVALGNTVTMAGTLTASALSTVGTIAGSICATSAGLILYESGATSCTISRAELKDIMGDVGVAEAWSAINILDPIAFKFKDGTGRPQLGFTAENAQAADPRLATYDGDGKLQAYDPNGMIALLTVAVKDQQHEIAVIRILLFAISGMCFLYVAVSVLRRR